MNDKGRSISSEAEIWNRLRRPKIHSILPYGVIWGGTIWLFAREVAPAALRPLIAPNLAHLKRWERQIIFFFLFLLSFWLRILHREFPSLNKESRSELEGCRSICSFKQQWTYCALTPPQANLFYVLIYVDYLPCNIGHAHLMPGNETMRLDPENKISS